MGNESERGPTAFGFHLLRLMAGAGYRQQKDLVAATGISASTVSRLIYSGEYRPDTRTFERLAVALGVPPADLFVAYISGAATMQMPATAEMPRIVAELAQMLAADSPLPDDDRQLLAAMLDRLIDPYRKVMRRHRA